MPNARAPRPAGASVVVHSGGPTAVINASLLGIVEENRRRNAFGTVWGARFGLDGLLRGDLVDLSALEAAKLEAVAQAPSSALGTSRREPGAADTEALIAALRARDAHTLFYTGGNGSMGAALQISGMARQAGYELQVIGIPKTIDNDLAVTDHTPGYGSAARFFACAVRDIGADNRALVPGQVEIVEVLGRNAGWIIGATALARHRADDPPHLIYFPEDPLPLDRFLADVDRVFRRLGRCLVAVCEGQLDEHGQAFGADTRGGSRGQLAMNVGHRLATLVNQHLGLKARSEKPGILGRVPSARSERDWDDARLCGCAAVRAAASGESDVMVTLQHGTETGLTSLASVAGVERHVPAEWRAAGDVGEGFLDYVRPLAGEVPSFEIL